jgi:hypothetical protein
MNIHHRIVAVLHILFAAAGFALLALVYVSVDFAFSFIALSDEIRQVVMSILSVLAVPLTALCAGQLVAALLYLNQRLGARPWLIAFGALQLLNLPFGTALGVYTLWALLAVPPLDPPAAAIVTSGT